MGSVANYWLLVRLDGTGQRRVEEVAAAKDFFQRRFPLAVQSTLADAAIQKQLMAQDDRATADRLAADLCLRCYISHQIEQICVRLEQQFGLQHGFSRRDLFPLVLMDQGQTQEPEGKSWRSLPHEILQSFDPDRSSLNTWTLRQVRHYPDLNRFLLEHGVYLITDWAILNDTNLNQVRRILAEFHTLSPAEIEQAAALLQGYHLVYRQDRFQQKLAGVLKGKQACAAPNPEQLARIAAYLEAAPPTLTHPRVLGKLQTLAAQLRQYRIHVRGGTLSQESLDRPEARQVAEQQPAPDPSDDSSPLDEFLHFYRAQFQVCLDETIQQVTSDRVAYLQRQRPQAASQFLQALHLFHCRGQSMGEIATQIGLQAQYQVTRVLKLKEFRADIRQRLLRLLNDRILPQAKAYASTQTLQDLDRRLETALAEQVEAEIQQAETEAAVAKSQPLTSLLARRLCLYLDRRLEVPTNRRLGS